MDKKFFQYGFWEFENLVNFPPIFKLKVSFECIGTGGMAVYKNGQIHSDIKSSHTSIWTKYTISTGGWEVRNVGGLYYTGKPLEIRNLRIESKDKDGKRWGKQISPK